MCVRGGGVICFVLLFLSGVFVCLLVRFSGVSPHNFLLGGAVVVVFVVVVVVVVVIVVINVWGKR